MKKKILTSLIIFITLYTSNIHSSEFNIKAKTVILQDYLSGEILYEKEPDRSIYPH